MGRKGPGGDVVLFSYINHHVTADDISTNGIQRFSVFVASVFFFCFLFPRLVFILYFFFSFFHIYFTAYIRDFVVQIHTTLKKKNHIYVYIRRKTVRREACIMVCARNINVCKKPISETVVRHVRVYKYVPNVLDIIYTAGPTTRGSSSSQNRANRLLTFSLLFSLGF